MQIRTVLVEDEKPAMQRMKMLLGEISEISIEGEASNGRDAVDIINRLRPDLIFVDIRLPEMSGFEVISELGYKPMIIFATAYDNYALKAFEVNSIDYILKPVSRKRIKESVKRVLDRGAAENMNNFITQMLKKEKIKRRFTVKRNDEIIIIPEDEIYYFQSSDKYIFLNTFDTEYFCSMTLKELEDILDPEKFCRIHKSLIIALDKIHKIEKIVLQDYRVRMSDQKKSLFRISRTFLPQLKEKLGL